jgi:hypothetical protein
MHDDSHDWTFDVTTSPHDDVKQGRLARRHSRVTVSRSEFPDWRVAMSVAACLAVAVHGGMPTSVLCVY